MNRPIDQSDVELRDPELRALLMEAFADDPALAPAPGRADRIMRAVLASGVRPARRVTSWWTWAWAGGAVATAAVIVFMMVGIAPRAGTPIARNTVPTPPSPPQAAPAHIPPPANAAVPAPPAVATRPAPTTRAAHRPTPVAKHVATTHRMVTHAAPAPAPVTERVVEHSPTRVAAAFYSAGTAARQAGDQETAYEAYQASYDEVQTPEALMASARALQQVAQQELATEIYN